MHAILEIMYLPGKIMNLEHKIHITIIFFSTWVYTIDRKKKSSDLNIFKGLFKLVQEKITPQLITKRKKNDNTNQHD